MSRRTFTAIAALMLAVGAAVRLNNVVVFPSLRAFDGFGHFTYIWYLAETGRVPLGTEGWSFFHPPLYYALMAGVWNALADLDPVVRLKIGTGLIALLGLGHAAVSYLIVRRCLPHDRVLHLLAPGLMLFLPVHLYSAGFLGNESLNAVLCSFALLALLAWLRRPAAWRAVALGVCLGAAMLTKFTAFGVVLGAVGTLAAWTLVHREWKRGIGALVLVVSALLLVSGWFYARNVQIYGTPFKMSREEFMVQRVERIQTKGRRTLLEYVLFDPVVLYRPQWPRDLPLAGPLPAGTRRSALRESVPTGLFVNAWFGGSEAVVLPPVTGSEETRRAGQLILTLALVPSILMLVGLWTAVQRVRRAGWDDTLVASLITFGALAAIFVVGTRTVPAHVAVKATYLTPVTVIFSLWLALGFERVARAFPRARAWILGACVGLAVTSAAVFCQDRVIVRGWLTDGLDEPTWQNLYGLVYYAGGDPTEARRRFERAATKRNWHLGHENVAALDLEEGRVLEALHRLRIAAQEQPRQSFGLPADRRRFNRTTQAEYLNSMAVIYYRLGWLDAGIRAARKALAHDPSLPQAHYDLAVLELSATLATAEPDDPTWAIVLARCRRHLDRALELAPDFADAWTLLARVESIAGDCDAAHAALDHAAEPAAVRGPRYPLETGPGDMHAAGLHRRRHIDDLPPVPAFARCDAPPRGA